MRAWWLVLWLFLGAVSLSAQPRASARLEMASHEVAPGGRLAGVVVIAIPEGFHANANPASEDWLIPTTVSLAEGVKGRLAQVRYPRGVLKKFAYADKELAVYEGEVRIPFEYVAPEDVRGEQELRLVVGLQMCDDASCYPPTQLNVVGTLKVLSSGSAQSAGTLPPSNKPNAEKDLVSPPKTDSGATKGEVSLKDAEPSTGSSSPAGASRGRYPSRANEKPMTGPSEVPKGILGVLAVAFLAGLALNLTPCVYPLIPITLGFFSMQAKGSIPVKFALGGLYALGIALSFGAFGVIPVLLGKGFGALFQNAWFNLALFLLLGVLALSMLGAYEIQLPRFLQKQLRGRSGMVGAFMMGALLGVAAAPCGTALIAALAVLAAESQSYLVGLGLFTVIGLGVGLPYVFLAVAGAQLPQGADWLVTLKRLLGLLVVMFAVTRYLSAGLTGLGWGIEYRHTQFLSFLAFILGAGYLLWVDRSYTSRIVAGLRVAFALALVFYGTAHYYGTSANPSGDDLKWRRFTIEEFEESLGKGVPVIVDGTANWCAACMEIEHKTFSDPAVREAMKKAILFRMDMSTGVDPEYQRATQEHFGWKSLPHIRVYDGRGVLVHIQQEFISAKDWLEILSRAGIGGFATAR